jgi:hypothetical protein
MDSPEMPPGSVGEIANQLPLLTHAHIRPYVVAILLHRGAVAMHEIVAAITPHARTTDLKVGEWDLVGLCYCEGTRLEKLAEEVLHEFVANGYLYYNGEKDLWVLTDRNLTGIISWISTLNAQMPQNIIASVAKTRGFLF